MGRNIVDGATAQVRTAAKARAHYAVLRRIADLPGPKGAPLLGNAAQLDPSRFHRTLENWAREFGPIYRFSIMRRLSLAVSEHDLVAEMLRDRPELLRRSSYGSDIVAETAMPGLFTAEGEEWRRQRKLVMHTLTPEVVHRFFPRLAAMTERLRRRWQLALAAGLQVDVLRDLKAYTLDVTIALSMGQDINALEHEDNPMQRDIEFLFNRIARRLVSPFAYWRKVKLPVDREAVDALARIQHAIAGFIAETRTRIAAQPELRLRPSNMLEAMVCARDEPDSGFDDRAVIGNAIIMVFAGEDTTSNSIAWLLNFLLFDRQAATAAAAEADRVLGGAAVLHDYSLLEQLPYIDAATREAMRLKPVAPVLVMEPNVDLALGDLLVPAGTEVFLLTRRSAERSCALEQAQAFRPQRWLDVGAAPVHETTHAGGPGADPARKLFPFGGGPRFCPGRYLAMTEIRMVMSMLMRNFSIEPIAGAPEVEERFTFTMTPSALPLRLRSR